MSAGESLHATASLVRRWVLVEQPGAWGRDAPLESRLPHDVASGLRDRARRHGFRLLLLRRPASFPAGGEPRCFIAHSARATQWIEEATVPDPAALLDVDFGALARGELTGFGTPRADPLYLVCTNGRHDPCCARLGRPVARVLTAGAADAVWECSHVGGDRFAGNLVCLPHGLYFGGLGTTTAAPVADAYKRGLIELDHYRGRAGDPYAVQAAEFFLRRAEGLFAIDDVVPVRRRSVGPGVVEVDLAGPPPRRYRVRVTMELSPEGRPLTCTSTKPENPPVFSLVDLQSV
jgi:hypothetical protein